MADSLGVRPKISSGPRRLEDLRRAKPADNTLENLLQVLNAKLELCARLSVYEFEAETEGHLPAARAFRELADAERASFDALLQTLRGYLDEDLRAPDAPFPEPAA
jgi:hypothetical protein